MQYVGTAALTKLIQLVQTALNGKANTNHSHSAASGSAAGFMSAADKIKLDGLTSGSASATTATATLTTTGWSGTEQTVSVTGATASNNVIASPAPGSHADYFASGCHCSAQGSGTLTFTCTDRPSAALTVNVLILS